MMATLRRWFVSGLLVILPVGVTIWVIDFIVSFLDGSLKMLPQKWQPEAWLGFRFPGMGVVLVLVVVLVVGAVASSYAGFKLVRWWDGVLSRIPIVRPIYSAIKQVSDTLFSGSGHAFREVVLIQYPRNGIWTVAFVTGKPEGALGQHLDPERFISVFVPATPNPTSGFYLILARDEAITLKMSADEALKTVVSMGVIAPPDAQEAKAQGADGAQKAERMHGNSADNARTP